MKSCPGRNVSRNSAGFSRVVMTTMWSGGGSGDESTRQLRGRRERTRLRATGRARWSAVVAVLVGLAAAGVAYAAIPDSSGIIHGCYAKKDGSLRVIDPAAGESCDAKKENPLSWNQTGLTGPQGNVGPTGSQGPAGPTGPVGPSNAYANYGPSSFQRIGEGRTQTVASVTLPAGSYTLAATVFGAALGDARNLSCYFVSFGTLQGHAALLQLADIASNRQPLIGEVTIALDNTSVFLRCSALDGDFDVLGELIATRVGAITPSE